jgi:hypothetical protein
MHRRIKRFPSPLSSPSPQNFSQRHKSLHRSRRWRRSVSQPAARQPFGIIVLHRVRAEQRQRALQFPKFLAGHRLRRKLGPPHYIRTIVAYSPYLRLGTCRSGGCGTPHGHFVREGLEASILAEFRGLPVFAYLPVADGKLLAQLQVFGIHDGLLSSVPKRSWRSSSQ